jgi:hypothetical protein
VITFHRIARSSSTGIRDHLRPERAAEAVIQLPDRLGAHS